MKPSTIKRQLVKARNKIKKGWTQGVYARNVHGMVVPDSHPTAVSFCAIGAVCSLYKSGVAPPDLLKPLQSIIDNRSLGVYGSPHLHVWNDMEGRTQQDVIDLYNKAIDCLS